MHYDRNIVLLAFRVVRPDELSPSDETLEQFDMDLHSFFQAAVEKEAKKKKIPATKFNFSMLVFFADQTESNDPQLCAEDACTYFKAVKPVP